MDINKTIEHLLESAMLDAQRARNDIDAAAASGKEIVQVVCDSSIKRGDTIDITLEEPVEGEEEEDNKKARVIACHSVMGVHPETLEVVRVNYAWCAVLEEGDSTSEEEFAALYADDEDTSEEGVEEVDPNVCSCGANREMCARNQNVFGGHLND